MLVIPPFYGLIIGLAHIFMLCWFGDRIMAKVSTKLNSDFASNLKMFAERRSQRQNIVEQLSELGFFDPENACSGDFTSATSHIHERFEVLQTQAN